MKSLILLLFIPSIAIAGDLAKEFNLKMEELGICQSPTSDFSSSLSSEQTAGNFYVMYDTAINCATKLQNPRLYFSYHGITIAVDEISESGFYTACKCRSEYKFSFHFEEFEEYQIENLFLTINGAVTSESTILNKSMQPTANASAD